MLIRCVNYCPQKKLVNCPYLESDRTCPRLSILLFKIYFNIILTSTPKSWKLSLSFTHPWNSIFSIFRNDTEDPPQLGTLSIVIYTAQKLYEKLLPFEQPQQENNPLLPPYDSLITLTVTPLSALTFFHPGRDNINQQQGANSYDSFSNDEINACMVQIPRTFWLSIL